MADKCLIEVKRVIKDLLTDEEVNNVLTRVKSNLAAEQALKKANIEESKLAQKVIDEIEIEQAIKDSDFNAKKVFYYDSEPTKLTKQIELVEL